MSATSTPCDAHWPLYRIDAQARPACLGELHALHGGGYRFESATALPAFRHGDFADGVYPRLPWFLDDLRPLGFLGRAFARRVATELDAPDDLAAWRDDDMLRALLCYGDDAAGDLVLGEASLRRALQATRTPSATIALAERQRRYPQLADAVLRGEHVGGFAGGDQPKFAITLCDATGYVAVIVKFSGRIDEPAGRRWADLLVCEHHAGEVLRAHGLPAARSELIEADARVFLESTRFDRTPVLGRRGLISLAALNGAHYRHAAIEWRRFAPQLVQDGWLDADDARRLRVFDWFGTLIANTDMHLGNASLALRDARPLPLAPCYDMLPMRFRPSVSGALVERRYQITLPAPDQRDDWVAAAPLAREFWARVAGDARVSAPFRAIAAAAGRSVERARAHFPA